MSSSNDYPKNSQKWRFGLLDCTESVPWYVITITFPYMTAFEVAKSIKMRPWGILGIALMKLCLILFTVANLLPKLSDNKKIEQLGLQEESFKIIKRAILLACALLIVMFLGVVMRIRNGVRMKFNIEGNLCRDLVDSCCCWVLCTLCQMRNQLYDPEVKNQFC